MSDPVVRGRPEAAAPFAVPADPVALAREHARTLRKSGVLRATIAFVVASIFFVFGRALPGALVSVLGGVTLVLALASPGRGYAALARGVDHVGELVGSALAWLLLAPVFFLFFAPFRLLFRRGGRDPLARGLDRSAKTYWLQHGPPRDLEKPY